MHPLDRLGRPLSNLRVSVTDRCNLRCGYCMPNEEYSWLPKKRVLSFEEIGELVGLFVELGVSRVRLTGGEPLIRRELPRLVETLRAIPGIEDLALTTNGLLLEDQAAALRAAGLMRMTVSLDTLVPERFLALTRREYLDRVLAGLEAARAAHFDALKIDTVVLRGTNDDELVDLLEYARGLGAELRFIEYMDVGGATSWTPEQVVSRAELLTRLGAHYGAIEAVDETNSAPADRFRLPDGLVFGVIASTTSPFCASCDRSRLTADGHWYRCLYAREGLNLRKPLRKGATREELLDTIATTWRERDDQGAVERLREALRRPLASGAELRADPHLEMHTRGG